MVKFSGGLLAEAVIFDFDGVIVDTEPLHYAAFQRLLEPLGLGFSWEQYVETYMGFDDRDAFIEAFKADGTGLVGSDAAELHRPEGGSVSGDNPRRHQRLSRSCRPDQKHPGQPHSAGNLQRRPAVGHYTDT